jgi:nitric oxide reductase subunit B
MLCLDVEARARFGSAFAQLTEMQKVAVGEGAKRSLKGNRYDEAAHSLVFSPCEHESLRRQEAEWQSYFAGPQPAPGLPSGFIRDTEEIKALNVYLAWATWATLAVRPGTSDSYTNNWPYEPLVGNTPPVASGKSSPGLAHEIAEIG